MERNNVTAINDRFSAGITEKTGVNTNLCWQCKCCSGGCPFSDFMDYLPNQVIRLIQLGMKKEVLECSTIWVCVGCHTCSMECPQAIDMAAVNDALRQMARKEGVAPGEPDICTVLWLHAGTTPHDAQGKEFFRSYGKNSWHRWVRCRCAGRIRPGAAGPFYPFPGRTLLPIA